MAFVLQGLRRLGVRELELEGPNEPLAEAEALSFDWIAFDSLT